MRKKAYVMSKLKNNLKDIDSGSRFEAAKQSAQRCFCQSSLPTFKTKPSLGNNDQSDRFREKIDI